MGHCTEGFAPLEYRHVPVSIMVSPSASLVEEYIV
jgi:hypothetical protein